MLAIDFIRENKEAVVLASAQKNVPAEDIVDNVLGLDDERRLLQAELDDIQRQRNETARLNQGHKPTAEVIAEGKKLKEAASGIEGRLRVLQTEIRALLERLPNMPSDDTPRGPDERSNVVLRTVGKLPKFDFTPQPHEVLGERLGLIDSERAAKVTGSRFAYLKGPLVWLQFALVHMAMARLTNEEYVADIIKKTNLQLPDTPFIPVLPPVLITPKSIQMMARLEPREDRYHIPSDDLYLVGSAEHTLGAMHMNETFREDDLPRRYVGFSTSFRREAGSYGRDVKGILRVHQFDKLEMESFTLPEFSGAEQDLFVAIQEELMQALELPYQVVITSTGDMGAPDARHLDIETWMPGQNTYRETHSADLMTDYQARRLGTRVKRAGKNQYVHMNDGTVFAMGRIMIAILENYQQADGSVVMPTVLHPYLPFSVISPPEVGA